MNIGRMIVDDSSLPYVIAEIGVNHEGSLQKAQELIEQAREGGANAAKFQSYKAHTLASKHSPAYWDTSKEPTQSQYKLFKKYDAFGKDEYVALAQHCREIGIDFLSTPFDDEAVEFLAPLVPCMKIASADLTNIPFLRKIAKTGKPVVLSTGASTLAEIDLAVSELRKSGCREMALLHCVLNYPTGYEHANLNMIEGLRRAYPELVVGYSDHTLPDPAMAVLTTAYLKGARILEKHFTHDKNLPGNDHYHAMDVRDLQKFREQLGFIRRTLGQAHKAPLAEEQIARDNARRSLVLKKAVRAGEPLTDAALTYKRPGTGISPLHWDEVIGRNAARDLEEDHLLRWEDVAAANGASSPGSRLISHSGKHRGNES
jgi:N-acetylneuraminate synthase